MGRGLIKYLVALLGVLTLVSATAGWAATLPPVSGGAEEGQVVSSQQAVNFLNAQRAANGLPSNIVENPAWSDACAKHSRYVKLNGGIDYSNPHSEDPSLPGYTPEGAKAAGNSVLGGSYGSTGENPWESAPLHLMGLLAPGLVETGYAPGCMWVTGLTTTPPAVTETYTYPGSGATIYPSETAYEWPFQPGEFVGIPDKTATGPYLFVFAHGSDARCVRVSTASLSGPTGPVDVRHVDNFTDGLANFMSVGAMLIPRNPLEGATDYHAVVEGTVASGYDCEDAWWDPKPIRWEWSFRTSAPATPDPTDRRTGARPQKIRLRPVHSHSRLKVDIDPNGGANWWVRILKRQDGRWVHKKAVKSRGMRHVTVINMPKGRYQARVILADGEMKSRTVNLRR